MHRAAAQPGGNPVLTNRFLRLLTLEAVLGVFILLWVGAFTSLPPSRLISGLSPTSQGIQMSPGIAWLGIEPSLPTSTTGSKVQASGELMTIAYIEWRNAYIDAADSVV